MCRCDELFRGFKSEDLESIKLGGLTKNRGVYAIRIKKRGKPISDVISFTERFSRKTKWVCFNEYVLDRTSRLKNTGICPII